MDNNNFVIEKTTIVYFVITNITMSTVSHTMIDQFVESNTNKCSIIYKIPIICNIKYGYK